MVIALLLFKKNLNQSVDLKIYMLYCSDLMVAAAPNKCIIIAKIKNYRFESDSPLKYALDVEVLDSKSVEEFPNFGKRFIGSTISATASQDLSKLKLGITIQCEAKYVGGPLKGKFRVSDIKELPTE